MILFERCVIFRVQRVNMCKCKKGLSVYKLIISALAVLGFLTSCEHHHHRHHSNLEASITETKVLFDGTSLENFDYMKNVWTLQNDGSVKGETRPDLKIKTNTFMISKDREIADFEANLWYKLTTSNNSGIIYRAEQIQDPSLFKVKGYQCEGENDLLKGAFMYDEARRAWVASPGEMVLIKSKKDKKIISQVNNHEKLIAGKFVNNKGWNHVKIVARGNHFAHYINGELSIELIDEDPKDSSRTGAFCLQVHAGSPMTVFFKDVVVKKYTQKFGNAQALFIDDLSGWDAKGVSTKKVQFTSPNGRGLTSRGYKEGQKLDATEAVITNGKMSKDLPGDGIIRFHIKGSATLDVADMLFSVDNPGNIDGFAQVEVLVKDGQAEAKINGKAVASGSANDYDFIISAKSASVRNVVFLPFAK